MKRPGIQMLVVLASLAAWTSAGPALATTGGPGSDSLAIRSLASPALQSFT